MPVPIILNAIIVILLAVLLLIQLTWNRPKQ